MLAGRRMERITVASMKMAVARPKPNCLTPISRVRAKMTAVDIFVDLGLVPCQVQDGRLVNLLGPGAGQIR